ncbi:hypothetical protein ACLOJK_018512 [Asimina triloba]
MPKKFPLHHVRREEQLSQKRMTTTWTILSGLGVLHGVLIRRWNFQSMKELKVDIAAMYLEGDALDLFTWINPYGKLGLFKNTIKNLPRDLHESPISQIVAYWLFHLVTTSLLPLLFMVIPEALFQPPNFSLMGLTDDKSPVGVEEENVDDSNPPMIDLAEISFHAILDKSSSTTTNLLDTI